MHPAAVPGTPQHGHYIIGGVATSGFSIATPEQIKNVRNLLKAVVKKLTFYLPMFHLPLQIWDVL